MPWRHLEHPADVRLEIAAESPEALVGECSLAFYDVALGRPRTGFVPPRQPVVIPGSMGTASYVLAADRGATECFCSTCHGAGRRMSRGAALRASDPEALMRRMEDRGILVRTDNLRTLGEEAPEAYKNVDRVVDVVERAGLCRKVARLRPLGVIKG